MSNRSPVSALGSVRISFNFNLEADLGVNSLVPSLAKSKGPGTEPAANNQLPFISS